MSVILPAILPVFLMAALGFALAKTGRAMDGGTTAFLVATVGTPALVFSNLATTAFDPETLATLATATAIAIAFYLVVGAIALTAMGLKLPHLSAVLGVSQFGQSGVAAGAVRGRPAGTERCHHHLLGHLDRQHDGGPGDRGRQGQLGPRAEEPDHPRGDPGRGLRLCARELARVADQHACPCCRASPFR